MPAKQRAVVNCKCWKMQLMKSFKLRWSPIAQDIANQLHDTDDMEPDYDQILAKRPHSEDAVFAW